MCILATFEEILCYKQPFELSFCTSATACENLTLCLTGPVNSLIYSLSNAGKADRAGQCLSSGHSVALAGTGSFSVSVTVDLLYQLSLQY